MVVEEGISEQRRNASTIRIHDMEAAARDKGDLCAVRRPVGPPLAPCSGRERREPAAIVVDQEEMPAPSGIPAGGAENDLRPIGRPCRIVIARGVARDVPHVTAERIHDIDLKIGTGCSRPGEAHEHNRGPDTGPCALTARKKKKERRDVLDHDGPPPRLSLQGYLATSRETEKS